MDTLVDQDLYRKSQWKSLRVGAIYTQQLRALMALNGLTFTLWALFYLGVWFVTASIIFLSDALFLHIGCVLLLGNQLHALTVLQHECGHSSAYNSRKANLWVGRFFAWFIFMPYTTFTECHKRHHRYLGDPQRDPDEWHYAGGLLWMPFRISIFVPHFIGISLLRYGKKVRNAVLFELLLNSLSLLFVFFVFYQYDYLYEFTLIFVFPALLLALVINPISRGYEHFPMAMMARENINRLDLSKNTITVTSRLIGFLWANINFHVEHHIYPRIPFYNLPKVARLLSDKKYVRDVLPLECLFKRDRMQSYIQNR